MPKDFFHRAPRPLLAALLSLALLQAAFCRGAAGPRGKALSDEVFRSLSERGFAGAQKIPLTPTGQDEFAYNISILFSANKGESVTQRNEQRTLVLNFLQEDALGRIGEIGEILSKIESSDGRAVDVLALFTALDGAYCGEVSGGGVFARQAGGSSDVFVLCAAFPEGLTQASRILTGCEGLSTPLWLARACADVFESAGGEFGFPHSLLSLYRLGMLRGNPRMGRFISEGIPSVTVEFADDGERSAALSFIPALVEFLDAEKIGEWDTHYALLEFGKDGRRVWISEGVFITICVSVAGLTFLLLCGFSFLGKSGSRLKMEFIRSWYMIPLTIALYALCVELAQLLSGRLGFLAAAHPVLQFSVKIALPLLASGILLDLLSRLRLPIESFAFGYIISIVATANIFVFSSVDILLFVPFGAEYLIVYAARPFKRASVLIFFLIVLVFPFVPYARSLLENATRESLERIAFCSGWKNVALALALFPFITLWQRILVRFRIFCGARSVSGIRSAILSGAFAASLPSIVLILSIPLSKMFSPNTGEKGAEISERGEREFLSVEIADDDFLGMTTRHIKISSREEALRYSLRVSAEGRFPLYESTYGYSAEGFEASFTIPNFPPKEITVDYACDTDVKSKIFAEAVYEGNGGLFRERLEAEAGGGK